VSGLIYDLIVIGGGPAGYHAAELAGKSGLKILLAEKRHIGGVCLNEGCIPSKTLLYSAKLFHGAVHGEKYGIVVENAVLDHGKVTDRKNKVVRTLAAGVKARLRQSGVTVAEGAAVIAGMRTDGADGSTVFDIRIGDEIHTGRRILIAAGSVPVLPDLPGLKEGLDSGRVMTNREIFELREVPGSLVVIGGGVVGLEMASYFNAAGSHVTVLEMLDHVGGSIDMEISGILQKNLSKRGIDFLLNSRVTEIRDDGVVYTSISDHSGGQGFINAGKVLVSIGRRPATEGLGLEDIGVATEKGRIITDHHCRTNVPGVYAAGDVNGISMLAHTAYREAEVCVNDILGIEDTMRYDAIPSVIYTDPEAAGVGETEASAADKGIGFETVRLPMTYSGRYSAENERGDGICKILADRRQRTVIGVHMIGSYSSEIIYGAAMMIEKGMRADELKKIVFPHPTVSEVIREAIFELQK
jgi:dihydrolipoamide dehydrogenase